MTAYFGTDGIRGHAGSFLTPELAMRAAYGFAQTLGSQIAERPAKGDRIAVLGRDSRLSSPMLAHAVAAGLALAGWDTADLEIVPTPLVPFVVLRSGAAGGVMVTASHNPVQDNGIKFFGHDGTKINEAHEQAIERIIDSKGPLSSAGPAFGYTDYFEAEEVYLRFLLKGTRGIVPGSGPKVVLDCAHGATGALAPIAFALAGMQVDAINTAFDGSRINVNCGATELSQLSRRVRSRKADFGLAFDGDGDRVLAVDHKGIPVSGDKIIALVATHTPLYKRQGAVVMTHMTNLGVEEALKARGIAMWRTDVGDAKVAAMLQEKGLSLGGEQSGHIIMRDRLPSGDGILTGLQLARVIAKSGRSLSELAAAYPEYPQRLTNLRVRDKKMVQKSRSLEKQLAAIRGDYADVRFYIRPSGTENLLRVLTEARESSRCEAANQAVCSAIAQAEQRS